jgi:hypothetical protein
MVLTVSFVLSPVTGLVCHRHQRIIAANLTPASGCQDHTTSPSAISAVRLRPHRVHRIPQPTFVTIAKRPSDRVRDGTDVDLIWVAREAKYFSQGDWTGQINLIRLAKSDFARNDNSCWFHRHPADTPAETG